MSAWLNRLNAPVLTWLCVASLFARFGFVLLAKPHIHAVEDFNIAMHLAHGDGFAYGGFDNDWHLTALKAPVYPVFLALFIVLFGEAAKLVSVLAQHALFAFLPIFFLRIGKALEVEVLGKFAALLFLLHPSYFYYPTVIETTNLFVPLAVLWLEWLVRNVKSAQRIHVLIGFGLLSGTLILTQPIALLPIVLSIAFLLRTGIKSLTLVFAAILLLVGIWTARNWLVFEKVIPTKSPFYMNLYVGLLPEYTGLNRFEFLDSVKVQQLNLLHQTLDDVEMEAHYKKAFVGAVKEKPMLYAQKTCWQAALYWLVPPRYVEQMSIQFLLVRALPVALLNVLFVLGMARLWKRHRGIAVALLLVLSYFTAVYALTHVANIRFKLDIEWLELFVCAAALQPKNQSLQ
ncbi:MAG: hypothetical protein SNJ55_07065 [Chloroherpetonaceae bacterium]